MLVAGNKESRLMPDMCKSATRSLVTQSRLVVQLAVKESFDLDENSPWVKSTRVAQAKRYRASSQLWGRGERNEQVENNPWG